MKKPLTILALLFALAACGNEETAPAPTPSGTPTDASEIDQISFIVSIDDVTLAPSDNSYTCNIAELSVDVRDAEGTIVGSVDLTEDGSMAGGEYAGHPSASGIVTSNDPYQCSVHANVEVTVVSDFYEFTATAYHPLLEEEHTSSATVSFEDATRGQTLIELV